jgi:hypothetical protein
MRSRRDAGMVTAELAACLPVLVLLLAVALSAISVAGMRIRAQGAARDAARAAARGDPAAARRIATAVAPGATVDLHTDGGRLVAVARVRAHPLVGWLPAISATERAVAAVEPSAVVSSAMPP